MDPLPVACARLAGQEIDVRAVSTHPRVNKCGILTSQMLADQAGSQGNFAQRAWRKDNGSFRRAEPRRIETNAGQISTGSINTYGQYLWEVW